MHRVPGRTISTPCGSSTSAISPGSARGRQPQAGQAAVEPGEGQAGMQARTGGGQDLRAPGRRPRRSAARPHPRTGRWSTSGPAGPWPAGRAGRRPAGRSPASRGRPRHRPARRGWSADARGRTGRRRRGTSRRRPGWPRSGNWRPGRRRSPWRWCCDRRPGRRARPRRPAARRRWARRAIGEGGDEGVLEAAQLRHGPAPLGQQLCARSRSAISTAKAGMSSSRSIRVGRGPTRSIRRR
jgi:hypothetical protein